ncbi:GIY-YIG nuclease family protein [Agathobaculum sp. NSJ-28]|uniref:GIY-YIG nuclease family protein n=2 Tax=Agathobaculum faecis TaxID=2763013 RepID=A0A923LV74_9FIRM|nr:GIY-YIG nuclease family protein [Agathobaculum faecis]
MRQEAEERKQLEQQQRQVEKEESKYTMEIIKMQEQLEATSGDDEKAKTLEARIAELQAQLAAVEQKKEEIISRQNGKAGYVYVISNLGSFGANTFKVGMTRRLDPMDRVRELGDASVPFSFDVHSFIFSDDAVGLESMLHQRLDSKRKNKINLRKEFFDVSLDELESLVQEIDPSAEFNRTMVATEYRQSLQM